MSFSIHIIISGEQKTTLLRIARGLKKNDPKYRFEGGEYFLHGNDLLGQVEVNHPGDESFKRQLEWLYERASSQDKLAQASVMQVLENATCLLFFQVLKENLSSEQAIKLYYPLLDWLFTYREGLR